MALLPQQKRDISIRFAHAALRDPTKDIDLTISQLDAAQDAIEQWLMDNAASLNAALSAEVRTALSTQDKARLLAEVALEIGQQRG